MEQANDLILLMFSVGWAPAAVHSIRGLLEQFLGCQELLQKTDSYSEKIADRPADSETQL